MTHFSSVSHLFFGVLGMDLSHLCRVYQLALSPSILSPLCLSGRKPFSRLLYPNRETWWGQDFGESVHWHQTTLHFGDLYDSKLWCGREGESGLARGPLFPLTSLLFRISGCTLVSHFGGHYFLLEETLVLNLFRVFISPKRMKYHNFSELHDQPTRWLSELLGISSPNWLGQFRVLPVKPLEVGPYFTFRGDPKDYKTPKKTRTGQREFEFSLKRRIEMKTIFLNMKIAKFLL